MCRALNTASFLATAFRSSGESRLEYHRLAVFRKRISEKMLPDGESLSVRWNRDSLDSTFGFYSHLFRALDDCVWCNTKRLEEVYDHLIDVQERSALALVRDCFEDV